MRDGSLRHRRRSASDALGDRVTVDRSNKMERDPPTKIPWGSVPRRYADLGILHDAHGGFRLVANECLVCKVQLCSAEPVGTRTRCPFCGAEVQKVAS